MRTWRILPLTLLLAATALQACGGPSNLPPVSPGRIQDTPLAGGFGTIPTFTPTPGPSPTATSVTTRVAPPLEPVKLPPDFGISVFAEAGQSVSALAVAPNGDVFATVPDLHRIVVMPDRDGDGIADEVLAFAEGPPMDQPFGIAFLGDWIYVATSNAVFRFAYQLGDLGASGPPETVVNLPPSIENWRRDLLFGADGRMYLSAGAPCNWCQNEDPRLAAVLQFSPEGAEPKQYSAGLRSVWGMAVHPETEELWASDQGRVGLGDDRPPDELNLLRPGGHFGWPHCYGDRKRDGGLDGGSSFCAATLEPAIALPAHAGAAGLHFYEGGQFPEAYRGNLFIALNGSGADRTLPTGYSVVRIPFEGGRPVGEVYDFASGWLRPDTRRWGSPMDLVEAADGSLLVSDDGGKRIYRIFFAAADRGEGGG